MRLRKAYAVAVSAVVLGLQLCVIVPPTGEQNWYWPFVDYPMYSTRHYAGEEFRRHELLALPCADGAPALAVDRHLLGIPRFRYLYLLGRSSRVAATRPEAAATDTTIALLTRLVRERVRGNYCAAELREQRFVIPESGPVERDPPWRTVYTWRLRESGDTPEADKTP